MSKIKNEEYVYWMLKERKVDIKWRTSGKQPTFILNGGTKTLSVKFAGYNEKTKDWIWRFRDRATFTICIAMYPKNQGSDVYIFPKKKLQRPFLKISYRQAFVTGHYNFYRENWEIITGGKPKRPVGRPRKCALKSNTVVMGDMVNEKNKS